MFNDVEDEDSPCDLDPFVGRDTEREEIKGLLGRSARAVQLVGQPMVGKSALAEKISSELRTEMADKDRKLLCYHMSCRNVTTLPDLLACLGACLDLEETPSSEIALVKKFQDIVLNDTNCFHLFLFLKCEAVHKNSFYVQFLDIVKKLMDVSKKVFVIITTQKPFSIPSARQQIIGPLSEDDIVTLVRRCAPDVEIDRYVAAIKRHCLGLPPLAMDAAQELVKSQAFPYTPEEFDEVLSTENRSKRIHASSDLLNCQASQQFEGLNDFLKKRILDISIFKGSFRVDDVLNILSNCRAEAKKTLNEMKSTGLVEYQDDGDRMRIQSVLQHYLRNIMGTHVTYDDTVRLRYVTLFVDVLKKADTELFIKPQQTVFGYLHDDWPNLRQVLEEAIHCTQNTYPAFLQVAMSAENLLVKCFPGEAVNFYEAMMCSATKFGTMEECAMQKWLLGMAKTIGKGTDLVEAMGLFQAALPVLRGSDHPECLVSLLADMGLNYNRQGKNGESRQFYLRALEESVKCRDGRKLTNRIINIRCYLAIPMIFLEYFDEAEELLNETLEESARCAPYHPAIPIMINSLGLIYERAGRSDDEALKYYTNSLAERRKYSQVAPGDLVVVLNNVAMQHSKRGNHAHALQLLSEAKEIRMKLGQINYHTALTCWNMSQVFNRKGENGNALEEIKYSLDVFKKCTKEHFVIVEVLLLASHLAISLENFDDAEKYLIEAVDMTDLFLEHLPDSILILQVLHHLVMIYQGYKMKCSPYIDMAVAEALRLAERSRESGSIDKYSKIMDQYDALLRVRTKLDQNSISENSLGEFLEDLVKFCHVCDTCHTNSEDFVRRFIAFSTHVCEALRSANRLLRSRALDRATEVLRQVSGISNSPPSSPTGESGPHAFVVNGGQDQTFYLRNSQQTDAGGNVQHMDYPLGYAPQIEGRGRIPQQTSSPGRNFELIEGPDRNFQHRIGIGNNYEHIQYQFQQIEVPGRHIQNAEVPGRNFQHLGVPGRNYQHIAFLGRNQQNVEIPVSNVQHMEVPGRNIQHIEFPDRNVQHIEFPGSNFQHRECPGSNFQHRECPGRNFQPAGCPGRIFQQMEVPCRNDQYMEGSGRNFQRLDGPYRNVQQGLQGEFNHMAFPVKRSRYAEVHDPRLQNVGAYSVMPSERNPHGVATGEMYETHLKEVTASQSSFPKQQAPVNYSRQQEENTVNPFYPFNENAEANTQSVHSKTPEGIGVPNISSLGINVELLHGHERMMPPSKESQSNPTQNHRSNTNIDKQKQFDEPLPKPRQPDQQRPDQTNLADPSLRFPPNCRFPRLQPISPIDTHPQRLLGAESQGQRRTSGKDTDRDFHKRLDDALAVLNRTTVGGPVLNARCVGNNSLSRSGSSGYNSHAHAGAGSGRDKRSSESSEPSSGQSGRSALEHDDRDSHDKQCCKDTD